MKVVFKKSPGEKGVQIPNAMLKISELDGIPLEVHTLKGATIIIPDEMDAMELIETADSLYRLHVMLLEHLMVVCGKCKSCGEEGVPVNMCPNLYNLGTPDLQVPDWALDAAGIPRDAKLSCNVDEESGEIHITLADYDFDINDIPPYLLKLLCTTGTCLGALEDMLIDGNVIYG